MRKVLYLSLVFIFTATVSKSQTAMQLKGLDCNGNYHDLFADLDANKAVLIHFFMSSCGSCPPPAQQIQAMANNILKSHPGRITAYAIPYNNVTSCNYTASWVSSNGLTLYAPFDSGATQVAHYGGFGMPTVVLLGGKNHRVMFSTLSYSPSDTSIMRDSILALMNSTTGIREGNSTPSFEMSPNPAQNNFTITLNTTGRANVNITMFDMAGKQVMSSADEKPEGVFRKDINTEGLPSGLYLVRLQVNGTIFTQKLKIVH